MSRHVMSCHVTLCHIMSWHVMSCTRHVISHRVASRRTSCYVISRRVVSRHVTSRHVAPSRVASCHVTLCLAALRRVMLRLVASCRVRVMLVKSAAVAPPTNAPLRFTQLTLTPRILTPSMLAQLTLCYITHFHTTHSLTTHLMRSRVASLPPQLLSFRCPTHVFQLSFTCEVIRSFFCVRLSGIICHRSQSENVSLSRALRKVSSANSHSNEQNLKRLAKEGSCTEAGHLQGSCKPSLQARIQTQPAELACPNTALMEKASVEAAPRKAELCKVRHYEKTDTKSVRGDDQKIPPHIAEH